MPEKTFRETLRDRLGEVTALKPGKMGSTMRLMTIEKELYTLHEASNKILREALEKALEVCKTTEMASFSLDVKYEIQKIRSVLQEALGATK